MWEKEKAAHAKGARIQHRNRGVGWYDVWGNRPKWRTGETFRIHPDDVNKFPEGTIHRLHGEPNKEQL